MEFWWLVHERWRKTSKTPLLCWKQDFLEKRALLLLYPYGAVTNKTSILVSNVPTDFECPPIYIYIYISSNICPWLLLRECPSIIAPDLLSPNTQTSIVKGIITSKELIVHSRQYRIGTVTSGWQDCPIDLRLTQVLIITSTLFTIVWNAFLFQSHIFHSRLYPSKWC